SDSIRPIAAPHPWYLGVFSYQGNDVKVIDLGCFILPDTQCSQLQDVNGRLAKIAVLKGSQWALACGKVLGVITVSGDDLLWRTRHGKRPWLAGTSTKHKFGLLDSAAMVTLFASGRRQ
ncbi:MAG: hypothetical protein GXP10_02755, partial [Gammaproteobacteria bacterium]|nr:hypothetical protein [Gammaproteobacteria bacterium]